MAAERVGLHNMNHGTVSNSGGIRIENSSLHTLLHFPSLTPHLTSLAGAKLIGRICRFALMQRECPQHCAVMQMINLADGGRRPQCENHSAKSDNIC